MRNTIFLQSIQHLSSFSKDAVTTSSYQTMKGAFEVFCKLCRKILIALSVLVYRFGFIIHSTFALQA